jgi:hypothetical protein
MGLSIFSKYFPTKLLLFMGGNITIEEHTEHYLGQAINDETSSHQGGLKMRTQHHFWSILAKRYTLDQSIQKY